MKFEILVDSRPSEIVIALLKDKQLTELHKEPLENKFSVGDIYLGTVKKIVPGLNAAFVDVGFEKDGFLHYLDLGPKYKTFNQFLQKNIAKKLNTASLKNFKVLEELEKDGKINETLKSGNKILVQVAKEPISTKGPRLTTELTIAGRYMVLVPFSDKVSVSQKIQSNEEKKRLKRLVMSIKPPGFGVIIRTVANGKMVAELDADLKFLYKKWQLLYKQIKVANAPAKVHGELGRSTSLLRDLLSDDFVNILVNNEKLHSEIKDYIGTISPEQEDIVKLYTGKVPLFQKYQIEKQIKSSFGKSVTMRKSTYLVIEHTEAMHVIDVNSGNRKSTGQSQEHNATETNMEVVNEIARILRLRDMGGIIAIDFIDMHEKANNKNLVESLRDAMKDDRAKHNIAPPSKFGVIELTRQRVRPETDIKTAETCPSCNGSGEVQASILLIDEIENNLRYLIESGKHKDFELHVHPFVESYLKKGIKSLSRQWWMKYKKKINVRGITKFQFLEYQFVNSSNEKIEL